MGWTVELLRNGALAPGDDDRSDGTYGSARCRPTSCTAPPTSSLPRARRGRRTAKLGLASPFTNEPQPIRDLVVPSGCDLLDLNLPIDPNGVVYASIQARPGRRRDADDAMYEPQVDAAVHLLRRSACSRAR